MKRPLCLLAVLLTAAVYIYLEFNLSDITGKVPMDLDGSYVTAFGKVQGKEFRKSFTGEILPVIYLLPNDQDISEYCLIQCYMDSCDPLPQMGSYALVSGRAKVFSAPTNPGEFDSRLYYSSLKISYRLNSCRILKVGGSSDLYAEQLFKVRMFLEKALDSALSEEDSSIMKAMLLGDKAYMDQEVKDMYKDSGIIHILAVSGLHISIIGMGVYELLKRLGLWISGWTSRIFQRGSGYEKPLLWNCGPVIIAIVFMYSYGVMCGMGTSSFRAICMFALRLLAPVLGRTYDVLNALALAAVLLLLDQPLYLYNSGFLFSFGAVLGITVVKPLLLPTKMLLGEDDGRMKFVEEEHDKKSVGMGAIWNIVSINRCKEIAGKAIDGLVNSLAIVITTLPVYASFYYTYPLHSLILNLIVIPVMGVLMMLGLMSMLLGGAGIGGAMLVSNDAAGFINLIGKITGQAVHMILAFYRWLCSGSAIRSGFTWYMGHAGKWQVALYVVLVVTFVAFSMGMRPLFGYIRSLFFKPKRGMTDYERSRRFRAFADAFRLALLFTAAFLLTFHVHPDLEVDMIDVGQGDGIIISADGRHMLIDGGSTSRKNVGKYQIIPVLKYRGIGSLDTVVLTHEDEDHISGIFEIMDDMEKGGIRIKKLILPEVSKSCRGDNYQRLEERAAQLKIPIVYINLGESFCLGKARFTCLNPELNMTTEGANAYSTVLFMKYGQFTALFTGDMEEEGLKNVNRVLRAYRDGKAERAGERPFAIPGSITLLKVAHHGSRYTTDEEFLALTEPKIALISCGRDNSYGHPHQELLERLDHTDTTVYRTDISGFISLTVQGRSVKLQEYLK